MIDFNDMNDLNQLGIKNDLKDVKKGFLLGIGGLLAWGVSKIALPLIKMVFVILLTVVMISLML